LIGHRCNGRPGKQALKTVLYVFIGELRTKKHPAYRDAEQPVLTWYRLVRAANWRAPGDVKAAFGTASVLKDGQVVFNIAGNKDRLVAWINYDFSVVFVRFIGTHRQYDAIDAQTI
jgi:mRNA interferase HigB